MPGETKYPFHGYNFKLEIDGIQRAAFRECSGLDAKTDVTEYREGVDKAFTPRKLSGLTKYSNITLKWGITDDHSLWDWKKQTVDGKTQRKNGSVCLMDDAGEEKLRWNFVNAWVANWTGPTFNATSSDVAIESVEIAHEGLTKA